MSVEARVELAEFIASWPKVYEALGLISRAAFDQGIEREIIEIVKVRVTQINGCAFGMQYHVNFARESGVSQAKLDQVSAWPQSRLFSARECAALAWAENLTRLSAESGDDALYNEVRAQFPDQQLTVLTTVIGHINMWNRISIALRMTPPDSV